MSKKPNGFRFQPRDGKILEALYAYEGVMSVEQLRRLFFGEARRTVTERMKILEDHKYVIRASRWKRAELTDTIYYLGKAGIAYLCQLYKVTLDLLKPRIREDRWGDTKHDLAINDFRVNEVLACRRHEDVDIRDWIPEFEFRRDTDTIKVRLPGGTTVTRKLRPDGFFVITAGEDDFPFLLEIDRATESNVRFARDKLHSGLEYLLSDAYKQRFGYVTGRWLVVTTTVERMAWMRQRAIQELGNDAHVFCYTYQALVSEETVLTAPIWYQAGESQGRTLLDLN